MTGAYSLMANVIGTSVLGLGFWIAAARLFDAETVGIDAALIAAMIELSTVCQLNMVNYLTRFLPSQGAGSTRTVVRAYALTGATGIVLGTGFALLAPLISSDFRAVFDTPGFAFLYVLAQVLWTIFQLQDAVLTAMRQAVWVPIENGVFGALKLVALPLLLALGISHGVFLAWVLPVIVLLVPVNVFIFQFAIRRHVETVQTEKSVFHSLGRPWMVRFMALDWGGTVLGQAGRAALPLIVVAMLGSRENAYLAIPFTIVSSFVMLFQSATLALVVEGAINEGDSRDLTARLTRRFAVLLVPTTIVLVAAAPLVLLPFGKAYADEGTTALRLLAIGGLLRSATTLYVAIARLQGRGLRIFALEGLQMVLLIVLALALATPLGINGVALAWLIATGITAAVSLPPLIRFLRGDWRLPPGVEELARAREAEAEAAAIT